MAIDKLLKRHFWAVILALVALAAFFDAQGIMHVVGAGLGADDKQLSAPGLMARVPPAPPSASPHATNAEPILARNPFDSVTGPLNLVPTSEASASAELPPLDMSDPFNAPDCDGVRVLIIAASADPDWSFAALETTAEKGKSFLRRRGGDVGGKTVKFIGWDRVWMANGNLHETLKDSGAGAGAGPGSISAHHEPSRHQSAASGIQTMRCARNAAAQQRVAKSPSAMRSTLGRR